MGDREQFLLWSRSTVHFTVVQELAGEGGPCKSTNNMCDFLSPIAPMRGTINRIVVAQTTLAIELEIALSLLLILVTAYVIGLIHTCERPNINSVWGGELVRLVVRIIQKFEHRMLLNALSVRLL